jgi:hypothetical protein
MPFSEKTRALLAALTPEQEAKVMRLVAQKLTNDKLRQLQRRAEEAGQRGDGGQTPEASTGSSCG